jgi:hypothetical protein
MGFEPMGARGPAELAIRYFRPLSHPSRMKKSFLFDFACLPHESLQGVVQIPVGNPTYVQCTTTYDPEVLRRCSLRQFGPTKHALRLPCRVGLKRRIENVFPNRMWA